MPQATISSQVFAQNILGLDLRTAEAAQDSRACVDCDGVILNADGAVSKLPGRKEIVTTGFSGAPVRLLFAHENTDNSKKFIAYADDGDNAGWYTWDTNGNVSSLGSVTPGGHVHAAQFKGTTILLGTKFAPKKYTTAGGYAALSGWVPTYGSESTTALTDGTSFTPGNNPSIVEIHLNRTFFAGDADNPSCLYYSVLHSTESWGNSSTDLDRGGWLNIKPNDGYGPITALASWQNYLVIFKERAIYLLEGSHSAAINGTDPFRLNQTIIPTGTRSRYNICKVGNDLIFIDYNNYVRSIKATITNAQAETLNLSYKLQSIFDSIPKKSQQYIFGADYTRRNHVYFGHYKDFAEYETDSNTKALWHLADLLDSSGRGLSLTNNNTATLNLGFNNYLLDSYKFNGSSQYLSIAGAAGSNNSTAYTALTLDCWYNAAALPGSGNKMYLYHEKSACGEFGIYLWNDSGTQKIVAFVVDSGGTERQAVYTFTSSTSTWYQVSLLWSGTTLYIRHNGLQQNSTACASIKVSGTAGIFIAANSTPGSYFQGKLDEIRVSDSNRGADTSTNYDLISTKNNRVCIYDYGKFDKNGQIHVWTKATDIIKPASMVVIDNVLYTGTYDGKIHQQDYGTTHGLSQRIGYYEQSWLNGKSIQQNKKALEIVAWLTAFSSGFLNVETVWQDRKGNIKTITLSPGVNDSVWESNWTTDLIWSSGSDRRLYPFRIKPSGHGKLLKIRFYGWEEGVQWTIVHWEIFWKYLGIKG